jgi:hypothetical protein
VQRSLGTALRERCGSWGGVFWYGIFLLSAVQSSCLHRQRDYSARAAVYGSCLLVQAENNLIASCTRSFCTHIFTSEYDPLCIPISEQQDIFQA